MHEIYVTNTAILIKNYMLNDCPQLERNFEVYNPITHSMDILGMYYSVKSHILCLPKGIDLWKVKHYLKVEDHKVVSPNKYEEIDNMMMKYKPRDNDQLEALKFMTGIEEYENNLYAPQLNINLSTGKGKTYCSIATMAYFRIKSIVITGTVTLLQQWMKDIEEYTNLKESDIMFISGSQTINMILSGKSNKAKQSKIFLCTHGTVRSFGDTYGWTKLNKVFEILGIGMKFIDESHTNYANMLMIDFFTNVFKNYYVTATPERSSWSENKIYQLSIKNIPCIDLFKEDQDPHTDYIAIKWNSKPTVMQINQCRGAYGLDRNKYINYVTGQPAFYEVLRIVLDLFLKCKGRGLFYIGTNQAIINVYRWIGENYPQLVGDIGIYTSIMDKEQKQKEREKKLLLSTTKSAGLGEDIHDLKMTVVLAEPFKSEVLAQQTLGRTRNPNTTYIELVDLGFRYIKNYYYSKLPIFNKYALSVSDTNIDSYELEKRSEILEEKQRENYGHSPIVLHDERFFKYDNEEPKLRKALYFIKDGKKYDNYI